MDSRPTILFLSGGSLVAQYALDVLGERARSLRLVATSSVADDPGLWRFDSVHLVPGTKADPAAFRARLDELVALEQPRLVLPGRDDDTIALAQWRDEQPDAPAPVMGGPAWLAHALFDKWLSYRLCVEHGLPHARSMIRGSEPRPEAFAQELGYPLVVKPRDGFASRGVFLVGDERQLQRALEDPNHIVQEYLDDPGAYHALVAQIAERGVPLQTTLQHSPKHSIAAMIGPDGRVAGLFASLHWHTFRKSTYLRTEDAETLEIGRRCAEVLAALGWRGPLNIQCQRDRHGRVKIHEFNGRYTGATAARALLGYDEVALGLGLFAGIDLPPLPWTGHPAARVEAQRYQRGTLGEDARTLERIGRWTRAGP